MKTAVSLALAVLAPEDTCTDVFESPQITVTVTGPDDHDENTRTDPDEREMMSVSVSPPHVDQLRSQVHLLTEENLR